MAIQNAHFERNKQEKDTTTYSTEVHTQDEKLAKDPTITTSKGRVERELRVSELSTALESWDYKHTPQEAFVLRFSIDGKDFKPLDDVWTRLAKRGLAGRSFAN